MLHHIVDVMGKYITSILNRKKLLLDSKNFKVKITITTTMTNTDGTTTLVKAEDSIEVVNGYPTQYSENIETVGGLVLDFISGRSSNKLAIAAPKGQVKFNEPLPPIADTKLAQQLKAISAEIVEAEVVDEPAPAPVPEPATEPKAKSKAKAKKKVNDEQKNSN